MRIFIVFALICAMVLSVAAEVEVMDRSMDNTTNGNNLLTQLVQMKSGNNTGNSPTADVLKELNKIIISGEGNQTNCTCKSG